MQKLVKAKTVQFGESVILDVVFETGEKRGIDLEKYLQDPVLEAVRSNPELFQSVRVERGILTWGEGELLVDVDPDVLYYDLVPAYLEATRGSWDSSYLPTSNLLSVEGSSGYRMITG